MTDESPTTVLDTDQVTEAVDVVEETPEQAKARVEAHNDKAAHALKFFARSVNQGEWLAVTRGLNMTRQQIGEDDNMTMLALAWIKDKREHGAASWDVLLELTDEGLLEFHGFITDGLLDDEA